MYNIDDIFTALQSGTDPEKIANDFTTALNAAIAKKEDEDKKAECKKVKKENALNDILDSIFDFFEEYYPDIYNADLRTYITSSEVIKILDEAYVGTIRQFKNLSDSIKFLGNSLTKESKYHLEKNDPITNFLCLNKLL